MRHPSLKNRVGEKYITNQGANIEIIEYFDSTNSTILFKESGCIMKNIAFKEINKGSIKNNNYPSVFNIGCIGNGCYKMSEKGKVLKHYALWKSILGRCYDVNVQKNVKNSTYKDVTVCEEWHNFQNFAKWFEDNYKPEYMKGWHLDKDILSDNVKIYSPETCCFIPKEINVAISKKVDKEKGTAGTFLIGEKYTSEVSLGNKRKNLGIYTSQYEAFIAYKTEKEKYIKCLAEKYKNRLPPLVYNKLYNFTIN